jgi:hypothetical protein
MELPGCPKILERCMSIMQKESRQETRGTLMTDIITMGEDEIISLPNQKQITLDADIRAALGACLMSEGTTLPLDLKTFDYPKLIISGLRFSSHDTTKGNGTIFFQPIGMTELVPAIILQIFSLQRDAQSSADGQVFLAVDRFLPTTLDDPFKSYGAFGASLWDEQTRGEVEVIRPNQRIYHANQQTWQQGVVVMKPTMKVSHSFCIRVMSTLINILRTFNALRINVGPSSR